MSILDTIMAAFGVAAFLLIVRKAIARRAEPPPEPNKIVLLYFDEFGAMTPITEFGAPVDVFSVHAREDGRLYRHTLKAGRDEINAMMLGEEWQQPVTPNQRRGNLKVVK